MKLISTRGKAAPASFCTAVARGIAEDGGLYVPAVISPMQRGFFESAAGRTLPSLALEITRHVLEGEILGPEEPDPQQPGKQEKAWTDWRQAPPHHFDVGAVINNALRAAGLMK